MPRKPGTWFFKILTPSTVGRRIASDCSNRRSLRPLANRPGSRFSRKSLNLKASGGFVVKVRRQPALHRLLLHPLPTRVILNLVLADLAYRKIARVRVCEIPAADRRGRQHGEAFCQG